ncbi:nucleotidyltransferase domain-containing protein [archaeon]|nr:nucleotidyltransferase domain-containing protein [archaeon]
MDKTIHKNGLVKKEINLLRPFVKEPWRKLTITEIKKLTKNRSHHYVFEAMKGFSSSGLLREERKGNTNTYSLNYESEERLNYLALIESLIKEERKDIPYGNVRKITNKLKSPFYTLLICGSYAEKKQKPTSDLDIAFIIPNSEAKKPYEIALKEGELMIPEVHGFIFTQSEVYQMLTNTEFNYGKEFAKKHIIIQGAEMYYKILFEAMRRGFKC